MTSQRVYFIGMAGFLVIYILFMIRQPNVSFKNGDILFQDLDCGAPCEAIEAVTQGYNGSQLSHCAIITKAGSSFSNTIVAEAIGEKVTTITLEEFLNRSNKVLVGRLKKEHSQLIPDVIKHIEENLIDKLCTVYCWAFVSYVLAMFLIFLQELSYDRKNID